MLDSLKNSITEAKEQARSAREQEQLARQAMSEAEEARDMAENARRNGMHDAAGQIEGSCILFLPLPHSLRPRLRSPITTPGKRPPA